MLGLLARVRELVLGTRAPPLAVDVEAAGRVAMDEARRLFAADIWDPPASDHRPVAEGWRDAISDMIGEGLGWTCGIL